MKIITRSVSGIFLCAIFGVALVGGIIFFLPDEYNLRSVNARGLVSFFQLVFGRLAKNPALFLICCGAIVGALFGFFLIRKISHKKIWLRIVFAFIAGILVGGALIFFPGKNLFEKNSAIWEDSVASERAQGFLQGLKAMDRGATNQLYISQFQNEARGELTNYIHDTNERREYLKNKNNADFLFTNSATYQEVQKYLAGLTNLSQPDVLEVTNTKANENQSNGLAVKQPIN